MNTRSHPSQRVLFRSVIIGLLAINIIVIGLFFWLRRPAKPNLNALALGSQATRDLTGIILNPPIELDGKSKAQVLSLRKSYVEKYSHLLATTYVPDEGVFGQIEDGLPWWGMEGQFYRGSGPRSIDGPAEESRFLANPYLLVAADFYGLYLNGTPTWDTNIVTDHALQQPGFPFTCMPRALNWYAKQAKAEVIYNVSECMRKMQAWASGEVTLKGLTFDLIAYNARDMNMNYMFVSFADSHNLEQWQHPTSAFGINHFLHRGGSCGYPGGCNNMSPDTPEISSYWLSGLPARLHVKLWRNAPSAVTQVPDMNFVIQFESAE
jgi:hypothetical protein